jgi:hypothetical protein
MPRAEMCTLNESHEHLLSASFDLSFQGNDGGASFSSSQDANNFGFNDNDDDLFAALPGGMDIDSLGDELAKELGWVENALLYVLLHPRDTLPLTLPCLGPLDWKPQVLMWILIS